MDQLGQCWEIYYTLFGIAGTIIFSVVFSLTNELWLLPDGSYNDFNQHVTQFLC